MTKAVTVAVVVVGAALLLLGFVEANSVPTSEGAATASALISAGALVLIGAAVFHITRSGRRG